MGSQRFDVCKLPPSSFYNSNPLLFLVRLPPADVYNFTLLTVLVQLALFMEFSQQQQQKWVWSPKE
jgi:hypothetical protein